MCIFEKWSVRGEWRVRCTLGHDSILNQNTITCFEEVFVEGFSKIDDFSEISADQDIPKADIHVIDSTSVEQMQGLNNLNQKE